MVIRQKIELLQKSSHKVAEKLYKEASERAETTAGPRPEAETKEEKESKEEEEVEADYEVIDEEGEEEEEGENKG
jgi:hypothetical protein